jgi:Uma2 family endonuclease
MATQSEQVILTYGDLQDLPEDRNRYELFEGMLEVSPSPSASHQTAALNLAMLLVPHVRQGDLGRVYIGPLDVVLSPTTVLVPDLLFVAKARLEIVQERFVAGPPDLVVEILSPTTAHRDRQAKRQLYARYGVPHYWLLDTKKEALEAYDLDGERYRLAVRAQGQAIVTAQPFPELAIHLAEIFKP